MELSLTVSEISAVFGIVIKFAAIPIASPPGLRFSNYLLYLSILGTLLA